jgi:hypothetical protein
MPTRNTNITLNLADDDEPAVQAQSDGGDTTTPDDRDTDESNATSSGVRNNDGSITVYGTSPPAGEERTENVPTSPLAAEISAFEAEIDHPDDFSATERRVVALQRLHPDLTNSEISDRLNTSDSTVSRACRKATLATLSDRAEIHAVFDQRTETQQAIISAQLAAPDRSEQALADMVGCSKGTVSTICNVYAPLRRKLDDVGLPADAPTVVDQQLSDETTTPTDHEESLPGSVTETEGEKAPFSCPECDETFDSQNARNGHLAVHSLDERTTTTQDGETGDGREHQEQVSDDDRPVPTVSDREHHNHHQDLTTIRQTVERLYDAAATEQSLCGTPASNASSAARQAICEVILTQIDAILTDEHSS